MAQKKVWMTWLPQGEGAPGPDATVNALTKVGLVVAGSRWVDDLEKFAWYELGGLLLDSGKSDIWIIAGRKADFDTKRIRYGLSLVSAMVSEDRSTPLSGICLGLDYQPEADSMPRLLRQFHCLNGTDAQWPAKVVAFAFGKTGATSRAEYRLNVIAHPMLGQWFEIGPRANEWKGVMCGVSSAGKITHHAVGACGQLPEKSVLEYPSQGIKATLGDNEFIAWSVQNSLGPEDSYYIRVEGYPDSIIIGTHPTSDDAEVFHLELT